MSKQFASYRVHLGIIYLLAFFLVLPSLFNVAVSVTHPPGSDLLAVNWLPFRVGSYSNVMQDSSGRIYVQTDSHIAKIELDGTVSFYYVGQFKPFRFDVADEILEVSSRRTVYRYQQSGDFIDAFPGSAGDLLTKNNLAMRGDISYSTENRGIFSCVVACSSHTESEETVVLRSLREAPATFGRICLLAIILIYLLCLSRFR